MLLTNGPHNACLPILHMSPYGRELCRFCLFEGFFFFGCSERRVMKPGDVARLCPENPASLMLFGDCAAEVSHSRGTAAL